VPRQRINGMKQKQNKKVHRHRRTSESFRPIRFSLRKDIDNSEETSPSLYSTGISNFFDVDTRTYLSLKTSISVLLRMCLYIALGSGYHREEILENNVPSPSAISQSRQHNIVKAEYILRSPKFHFSALCIFTSWTTNAQYKNRKQTITLSSL